jgi:hypothetical protein
MHVDAATLSMAAINRYLGREIPEYLALGLDPNRSYALLRDPGELAKGAASFGGAPILSEHVPVDATDYRPDLVVGSVGSDVAFDGSLLKASIVVWAGDAISAIRSGAQPALSAGYRYRADMMPGQYQGQRYDGVMRDIRGNHIALVQEGRIGPEAVIGDAALRLEAFADRYPKIAAIRVI